MTVIYHSRDLDGYCSGAICKHKFPDAKLIGYDYGEPFDVRDLPEGETVIMIDVSMPMVDMESISKRSRYNFTWIDHHVSAINDYKNHDHMGINSVHEIGIAACEIAWKYFFPDKEIPRAVQLLGAYDTWRNQDKAEWDHVIMPFQYGMRMICNSAETFPHLLFSPQGAPMLSNTILDGRTIIEYQKQQNERACRSAFEIEFLGHRAICLNVGGGNSQMFESVYDESKHDIMMPFFFTGKQWTFSIYTTKPEIDCSLLAKSMGGGGHKQAAGFQKKVLPDVFTSNVLM